MTTLQHKVDAILGRIKPGSSAVLRIHVPGSEDMGAIALHAGLVAPYILDAQDRPALMIEDVQQDNFALECIRVKLCGVAPAKGGKQGILISVKRPDSQGPGEEEETDDGDEDDDLDEDDGLDDEDDDGDEGDDEDEET